MKLIELGSDDKKFRTIKFKENGLNLILGKRNSEDSKSTYNGVGKSLALYLVQFCLGTKANKKITNKIPNVNFYLKFRIDGINYTAKRNTTKQSVITLNDETLKLLDFNSKMLSLLFEVPEELSKISFRSLISRFLRTRKEEYNDFDSFVVKEQEDRSLLSNSFLLGLDAIKVQRKFEFKEEFTKIDKLRKVLQKDEIFNSVFGIEGEISLKINELEKKISILEDDLSSFKVAENYKDIQEETKKLSFEIKQHVNIISINKELLSNIEQSIKINPISNKNEVIEFIKRVEIELNINIQDRINQVNEFHESIIKQRTSRFENEKKKLADEILLHEKLVGELEKKYNQNLKYINEHGGLEDFTSINLKLNDFKFNLDRIKKSSELIANYKKRGDEIKLFLAQDNLSTTTYLENISNTLIKEITDNFSELVKIFYINKFGGISIENNSGDNKLRYSIEARIQDDSSDGINEVKIFCFDLLLLTMKKNHKVKFLFHDSRLFSDMDTHQRFPALKLANKLGEQGFQYIASLNQDTYEMLEKEQDESDFKSIIKDNIIIELSSDNDESRLLGVHIDLEY
ncbi:DUF2326 domain-containing protein [Flavobacterium sp.]|uniref:DUF2326 domain-containing protein n=1 Tax=Flavobacterium sp. TaxID=239 RepID=UPI00333EF680